MPAPTEVVDDVYDITTREEPRDKRYRVFFSTKATPTLVDTGLQDTTEAVLDGIVDVGVEPERVIITHDHGDHVGGFDAVVERYDPETWVPEKTSLETDHTPDHLYGDQIGRFTAVHVPGHTKHNHALIDEDAGVAIMGDTVFGADHRGLPTGYFHHLPAVYSDDPRAAAF
ncbi:MBL fold metallo-hydrolase [Halocatena pleomorpha]|uniref:MBL fold metallo-hydrolase n=1 Tax=Halocatena pleomorpha TaxID=1785090 RepID=A0A3P3RMI3_9EURY|nr:MBL fold metallo-hydrolase [Halocatena pleomorpha]RRJ34059.1 MBL fold metallo-hydrolase [Halocatena pleomorpha]